MQDLCYCSRSLVPERSVSQFSSLAVKPSSGLTSRQKPAAGPRMALVSLTVSLFTFLQTLMYLMYSSKSGKYDWLLLPNLSSSVDSLTHQSHVSLEAPSDIGRVAEQGRSFACERCHWIFRRSQQNRGTFAETYGDSCCEISTPW